MIIDKNSSEQLEEFERLREELKSEITKQFGIEKWYFREDYCGGYNYGDRDYYD